jgi:hypothetical protein
VRRGAVTHRTSAHTLGALALPEDLRHVDVVVGGVVSVGSVLAELDQSWLERSSISFLSHAGALLAETATTAGAPLVIADPDGTLPNAAQEGRWVAARLGVDPIVGRSATRGRVLSGLAGTKLFHFSGHGVLEPSRPWDAHLVLASGETLSLEDLLVARPQVGLVVLSGCSTGARSELSRSERIGLPEAFSFGGARAVLATTGEIDDRAASSFVRRFYEAGGEGNAIEAWRIAARRSIAEHDETWKSFYVLGARE